MAREVPAAADTQPLDGGQSPQETDETQGPAQGVQAPTSKGKSHTHRCWPPVPRDLAPSTPRADGQGLPWEERGLHPPALLQVASSCSPGGAAQAPASRLPGGRHRA